MNSIIPLSVSCPCPATFVLPLFIALACGWGLWRLSQWLGRLIITRISSIHKYRLRMPVSIAIFAVLLLGLFQVLNWGQTAFRPTTTVELPPADLPRLIFLGANSCRPCQEMLPVREKLQSQYSRALEIQYHDVTKDPDQGHFFGIRVIPTTIFIAPDGRELLRRQGYLSETDIFNAWQELGFDFSAVATDKTEDTESIDAADDGSAFPADSAL